MSRSLLASVVSGLVAVGLGLAMRAQDLEISHDFSQIPRPSEERFQYLATQDPLAMLQQTIAANDALLSKQRDCLSRLATLYDIAQSDKSAAHRSTSHGGKKN